MITNLDRRNGIERRAIDPTQLQRCSLCGDEYEIADLLTMAITLPGTVRSQPTQYRCRYCARNLQALLLTEAATAVRTPIAMHVVRPGDSAPHVCRHTFEDSPA